MLEKIKIFFMKIFGIKRQKILDKPIKNEIVQDTRKDEFEKSIKISLDEDERILKLQKDFEAGLILEEELSEKDFNLLYDLYESQIEKKKKSIQDYRNKILALKEKLV